MRLKARNRQSTARLAETAYSTAKGRQSCERKSKCSKLNCGKTCRREMGNPGCSRECENVIRA
eukprot:6189296-Pleurochrysis_carterae.AAC.2